MSFKYAAYTITHLYVPTKKNIRILYDTDKIIKKQQHRIERKRKKIMTQTYRFQNGIAFVECVNVHEVWGSHDGVGVCKEKNDGRMSKRD